MTVHKRLTRVEILRTTNADSNGWHGLVTKNHGEIRCKSRLKTKHKLVRGWKGSITITYYGVTPIIADDQMGHRTDIESHWIVKDESIFDVSHWGFVYNVTNINESDEGYGRQYIGMKSLNGNWRGYTTSSKYINQDIDRLGKDSFKFEILFSCKGKGDVVYLETHLQHRLHVLTKTLCNGTPAYYNRAIGAIKFIPKMDIPESLKEKLRRLK